MVCRETTAPCATGIMSAGRLRYALFAGCILFALLLAGCSGLSQWRHNGFEVGPNYCPPGAAVADHWIDAANKNIHSEPAENICWWTVFNDPLLNQLVEATYRQNLSLRAAGLRICEARAELGIAIGNFFPQKQEASSQYTRNRFSANAYPSAPSQSKTTTATG